MSIELLIQKIQSGEKISFNDTMKVISDHYCYRPVLFTNGLDDGHLINEAGTNEGSCKIFAFAKMHELDKDQTLSLFGDYYWLDVLNDPDGTGHQNIRNFIKFGWSGISFEGDPLTPK